MKVEIRDVSFGFSGTDDYISVRVKIDCEYYLFTTSINKRKCFFKIVNKTPYELSEEFDEFIINKMKDVKLVDRFKDIIKEKYEID